MLVTYNKKNNVKPKIKKIKTNCKTVTKKNKKNCKLKQKKKYVVLCF